MSTVTFSMVLVTFATVSVGSGDREDIVNISHIIHQQYTVIATVTMVTKIRLIRYTYAYTITIHGNSLVNTRCVVKYRIAFCFNEPEVCTLLAVL